jgi:chondroitin 4-sulfotransferase 11
VPEAVPGVGRQAKYIISDEIRFVYFVVPKVACSSIKTALLSLFEVDTTGYESIGEDDTPDLDIHRLFAGSGYQINKNQLTRRLDRGRYREHFKFAFVRNPWDRLVSCYSDKVMDVKETEVGEPPFRHVPSEKGSRLYKGMSFAEFVETIYEIPDEESNMHFVSQYQVVCGPGEDGRIMADFVGRFENLEADFAVVAEEIGGARRLQLPHKLRSTSRESRPYTDFYDGRLKDLVYERYREDIEIFNYSFGDSRDQPPLWRRDGRAAPGRDKPA